MIRPMSAFVALGVVAGDVFVLKDTTSGWYGHLGAMIRDVRMLPRHVPLAEAQRHFPEWGFLRLPRRSTLVPAGVAEGFLRFLEGGERAEIRFAEESDIEGTKTEVVRLTSKRSRRLRDLALEAARGCCLVCRRDFTQVLGGRGVRVMQVHHRRQLSARDVPSVTRLSDLAVVCANCHLLLHLDVEKALDVEELREMLEADGCYGSPDEGAALDCGPTRRSRGVKVYPGRGR
jgi:hypothetical protein